MDANAAADGLSKQIAELKATNADLAKKKRDTKKLLKAAERKRRTVIRKTKALTDEDLLAIYAMRQQQAKDKTEKAT